MRKQVTPAPKTDFGHAPPGYVAGSFLAFFCSFIRLILTQPLGSGRGAIGFTTRSDIGPARPMGAAEAKRPPPGAPAPAATPKEPVEKESGKS